MDRTDLDIPESTVWPASDDAPQAPVASKEALDEEATESRTGAGSMEGAAEGSVEASTIELGPGDGEAGGDAGAGGEGRASGEQIESLDPDRDDAERNAAGGGWEGANEQIENDFETEQLREREGSREGRA